MALRSGGDKRLINPSSNDDQNADSIPEGT
jgi:hypothetical protein